MTPPKFFLGIFGFVLAAALFLGTAMNGKDDRRRDTSVARAAVVEPLQAAAPPSTYASAQKSQERVITAATAEPAKHPGTTPEHTAKTDHQPSQTPVKTVAGKTIEPAGEVPKMPAPHGSLRPNVLTDFNPDVETPRINSTAYVDPMASVIGNVEIGSRVYLAPFSSARGDEGQPIYIGNESNLQDGVVIHALETFAHGQPRLENTYEIKGHRYAVYIGNRVSLAHQSQVHGPAWVEDDTFIGMQALVFKAHVGKGCVIEPGAKVIGVTIAPGRYVKTGSIVTDQYTADQLPQISDAYAFRNINKAVVHVNTSLAEGYSGRTAAPSH